MDLTKSIEYFDITKIKERCHIIGCGSVGSTVAELLARAGIERISLYDFDAVSSHNIVNQMFFEKDINRSKVDALKELICAINPGAQSNIKTYKDGWVPGTMLSGYVFLCVDSIELRKQIVEENIPNRSIKAMFDYRTSLEEAQYYACDWSNITAIEQFKASMNFTDEEAAANNPVTACNISIGVAPTVRIICDLGMGNFMNFVKGRGMKKMIIAAPFVPKIITM